MTASITRGKIEHPERMRWTFSAMPEACDACRGLEGEIAEYGSSRWKVLDSLEHGCERGKRCRCGCTMMGISVG